MKITISSIPHKKQRYPTCGDYGGRFPCNFWIKVSHMRDWRYMLLVAIHETIEYALCSYRGIKNRDITAFDKHFEALRAHENADEPGMSKDAPYHREHVFATKIERMIAKELSVDWKKYDKIVNDL